MSDLMRGIAVPPMPKSEPERAYDSIAREISDFQRSLAPDMEFTLVAAGGGTPIFVTTISRSGVLITFSGMDESDRQAQLVQHFSQISFQLVAVPKIKPESRRIGF